MPEDVSKELNLWTGLVALLFCGVLLVLAFVLSAG